MATDPEVDQLRAAVSCAVVLERAGYKLDERESSQKSLKYRRGSGETVIVNHDGKGWWDTGSQAKGDVFTLAQHLDPSLNFGQVRRELRQLVGMAPAFPPAERAPRERAETLPPELRWTARKPVTPGSPTWTYLTQERGLTPEVVAAATRADALREGPYASAWFAHRDSEGALTGIEMRGPNYRGFSADGEKTLFRLQLGAEAPTRLAVTEAPIDAMSLAAVEGMRRDTLYISTAGGMGPGTIAALERELAAVAERPGGVLVAATDADPAGERYAARLAELAAAANVPAQRAAPAGHKDWNDALRARGQKRGQTVAHHAGQGASGRGRAVASPALAAIVEALRRPEAATSPPWTPLPIPIGDRVRAFEEQDALRAATVMARRPVAAPDVTPDQRPTSSPSPGQAP